MTDSRKILISECLCGGRSVRYDGADIPCDDGIILRWKDEGRLVSVCPEVCAGLSVPRAESQRIGARVVTITGDDVSEVFERGAEMALELAVKHDVCCCVMKDSSPSCGSGFIYDGSFSGKKIKGQGLTTELLRKAGYMVFSEKETDKAAEWLSPPETI